MIPGIQFKNWLDDLFQQYDLNQVIKNKFQFLTYENYNLKPVNLEFIVYEDWWILKPEIVKNKIKSLLKITDKFFGKQCKVHKINKPEADTFLEEHHFFGTTNSKVKYGLFYKEELIAVATFSGQRQFKNGRSVELLRSCNKDGYAIIGGMEKLLNAYIVDYKPDTIMTYIDLDWGNGNAFKKPGFEVKSNKAPITFYVDRKTGKRIPEKNFDNFESEDQYIKIKNKGSLKLVKSMNY